MRSSSTTTMLSGALSSASLIVLKINYKQFIMWTCYHWKVSSVWTSYYEPEDGYHVSLCQVQDRDSLLDSLLGSLLETLCQRDLLLEPVALDEFNLNFHIFYISGTSANSPARMCFPDLLNVRTRRSVSSFRLLLTNWKVPLTVSNHHQL